MLHTKELRAKHSTQLKEEQAFKETEFELSYVPKEEATEAGAGMSVAEAAVASKTAANSSATDLFSTAVTDRAEEQARVDSVSAEAEEKAGGSCA